MRYSLAISVLSFATFAIVGCPKPPVTPSSPDLRQDFGTLQDCPAKTPHPKTDYVCGIKQTFEGLRCVVCEVDAPCLYRDAMVYCTPVCADPNCK